MVMVMLCFADVQSQQRNVGIFSNALTDPEVPCVALRLHNSV